MLHHDRTIKQDKLLARKIFVLNFVTTTSAIPTTISWRSWDLSQIKPFVYDTNLNEKGGCLSILVLAKLEHFVLPECLQLLSASNFTTTIEINDCRPFCWNFCGFKKCIWMQWDHSCFLVCLFDSLNLLNHIFSGKDSKKENHFVPSWNWIL